MSDIKLNKRFYSTEAFGAFLGTIEILYDILDEGKDCGVFRRDLSNRVFRNLFLGAFSHLCIRWFVLERVPPIRVMSELASVTDLLCRAVVQKFEK